jgi:hypothetical protein
MIGCSTCGNPTGGRGIRQQRTLTTAHVKKKLGGRIVTEFTEKDRAAFREVDGA